MPQRRVGIFGGTFDPVHVGHIVAAMNARYACALDVVYMIVAPRPWQKVEGRDLLSPELRFEALEAAIQGVEGLEASRLEMDRPGLTYTVDTVRELHKTYPDDALFLIGGTDVAASLSSWKEPESIAELADFIWVNRPGVEAPDLAAFWRVHTAWMPPLEISSTDLRARLRDGRPVDFVIPQGALDVLRSDARYSS